MTAKELQARTIVQTLRARGFAAYLAGGCVRDKLLGVEPKDFDVATSARATDVQRLFAHTVPVGAQFGVVLATFAVAYPILGGLSNVFGTLLAVIFIQGFLIEGLRFMGDWRNLLFGGLIVLAMNVRPRGLLDPGAVLALKRLLVPRKDRNGA